MSDDFKKLIKKKRKEDFPNTFDIVHDTFLRLGLDKEQPNYFYENASSIVEDLRAENWKNFLNHERMFSEKIYQSLIRDDVDKKQAREAIKEYIHDNVDNFYTLSLSNTQSRRSRTGSEFENIISHLFMGADLPFDEQGLIGTGIFEASNLAKLVDHVVPGTIEYNNNKRNIIAVSAKTTLRERWQQIGDEMQRTRMPLMYLATLDDSIGDNTLRQLDANNIYPVTTKTIKDKKYSNQSSVLTFEELLNEAQSKYNKWHKNDYSSEEVNSKIQMLETFKEQQNLKQYVVNYIEKRLSFFRT